MNSATEQMIRRKYQLLGEIFNERERRLWAAVEASQLGLREKIWDSISLPVGEGVREVKTIAARI